jgi:hypothetical protein
MVAKTPPRYVVRQRLGRRGNKTYETDVLTNCVELFFAYESNILLSCFCKNSTSFCKDVVIIIIMRNCVILGSGRSGTNALAGILAGNGYYMGDDLLLSSEENPKGYFEDKTVNRVNEELLIPVEPIGPRGFVGKYLFRSRMPYGMRWLAKVPMRADLKCSPVLEALMIYLTRHEPYCFKDPRFSYTLGLWWRFLSNVVFACMFRDPGVTIQSILTHCSKGAYPRSILMNVNRAFEIWAVMYSHILEIHHRGAEIGFSCTTISCLMDLRVRSWLNPSRLCQIPNLWTSASTGHAGT